MALFLLAGCVYVNTPTPLPTYTPVPTPRPVVVASSQEDYYRGFMAACAYIIGDMAFCVQFTTGAWQRTLHERAFNWWPNVWEQVQAAPTLTPTPVVATPTPVLTE